MTTRKAIALVNGLFEEVNTPTDKLDFAGNTTTDLTEGSNLYYLDSRARASISVTDTGGDGSLSYDNTTGVITYTGPSGTDVRSYLSVAAGSGLTYNSTTGEFGTNAIPNSQLLNSSITVGSTSIGLGNSATVIAGLTSLTSADFVVLGGSVIFEGSTIDSFETSLTAVDPTADQTITLPDSTGTVALLESLSATNTGSGYGSLSYSSVTGAFDFSVVTDANIRGSISVTDSGGDGSLSYDSGTGVITYTGPSASEVRGHLSVAVGSGLTYNASTGEFGTSNIPNSQLLNSGITLGSTAVALGSTIVDIEGLNSITVGTVGSADFIGIAPGAIVFEGATANDYETLVTVVDPTADRTVEIPDETGILATQGFATSIAIALG